ncbi:hypothetical protein ACLQ3K_21195, partial [Tsukamurella sp. DT100]|uniref:hypothetical protein n=1 Tax=Tsukamurella sp. DT100 TaxID=3393415 RepID=UPI003CEB58DB
GTMAILPGPPLGQARSDVTYRCSSPRTRGAQSGAGARAATDDGVADPDARGKANGDNGGAVPK